MLPPETSQIFCEICEASLFETSEEISKLAGYTVWSHLEDTGCDDPVPMCRLHMKEVAADATICPICYLEEI